MSLKLWLFTPLHVMQEVTADAIKTLGVNANEKEAILALVRDEKAVRCRLDTVLSTFIWGFLREAKLQAWLSMTIHVVGPAAMGTAGVVKLPASARQYSLTSKYYHYTDN